MSEDSIRVPVGSNVSRAIARSRAVRASVARRRKRKALLAACLGLMAASPIAWFMAEPAAAVVASAADKARDLADLLNERSPGARTQAELTKHAREADKVIPQPKHGGTPATPDAADLLIPPPAPPEILAAGAPTPFGPPTTLATFFASAPGNASLTPPGGGGGGGGGGGIIGGGGDGGGIVHLPTSEPKEVLPPSAVPEPATWAMMLIGFSLIGWRLRRRNPAAAAKREAA